jgi:hypothetical protein
MKLLAAQCVTALLLHPFSQAVLHHQTYNIIFPVGLRLENLLPSALPVHHFP